MQLWLTILLIIILAAATLISLDSRRRRMDSGLPAGEVIEQDTLPVGDDGARSERALFSHRYGLVGRPDYLVDEDGYIIPVEVKTTRHITQPYDSQAMQLYAYCLLVEEEYGLTPPYGILRYPERQFRLPYGEREREWVIQTLEAMREDEASNDEVQPNHNQPARCRSCQFLATCGMDLLGK
jgi:CRISPR-associated exonuclease Cas4